MQRTSIIRVARIALHVAILVAALGCAPSAEQIATMTAAAWTPTPISSPTPTPIPYSLIVHVTDESGAGIVAAIILLESGSNEPIQTDAAGRYEWKTVNGPTGSLLVSATGYHDATQTVTLERGPNELVVVLQRDTP